MDCMEVVRKHKSKILENVISFLRHKNLGFKEIWVYKSRVAGTCRPNSDIDIYVQLEEAHARMVKEEGDVWGTHKGLSFGREMKQMGLAEIDRFFFNGQLWPIELDTRAGVEKYPPINQEKYSELIAKGVPYSIRLIDVW